MGECKTLKRKARKMVNDELKSTSYGRILIIISCLLFIEAYLFTNLFPAISAAGIILFLVYTKLGLRNTIQNLDIEMERTILEKILFADKPFNVALKIKSNSGIAHLKLEDRIPKGCSLHKGTNRYSTSMEPNKEYKFKYSVNASERGKYIFEGLKVTIKDTSKLFRYSTEKELVSDIGVHSGVGSIKKVKPNVKREVLGKIDMAKGRVTKVSGYEFAGIRDYIPGDRLKDIEWKTTSRLSRLMTKVLEEEAAIPSVILLDCSKSMRITTGDKSKIDHGIRLSLQLTKMLQASNYPVGLVAFDEHKVLSDISASTRHEQFDRIFNTLLYIPNRIFVDEYGTNPPIEPLPPKTEPGKRYIGMIAPFLTRKKRKYTSITQVTGIYEAIRALISTTERNQLLLLITDLETNLQSLHETLKLAKKYGHKVVLITPFTYWYDSYQDRIAPELLETIYQSYTEKQKVIGKLRGLGVKVIEIKPIDVGLKVIREMERP